MLCYILSHIRKSKANDDFAQKKKLQVTHAVVCASVLDHPTIEARFSQEMVTLKMYLKVSLFYWSLGNHFTHICIVLLL